MIDDGEYFFALFDENVVTNYLFGKQSTEIFEHGCFIYGYDSVTKVLVMLKMRNGKNTRSHMMYFTKPCHIIRKKERLRF